MFCLPCPTLQKSSQARAPIYGLHEGLMAKVGAHGPTLFLPCPTLKAKVCPESYFGAQICPRKLRISIWPILQVRVGLVYQGLHPKVFHSANSALPFLKPGWHHCDRYRQVRYIFVICNWFLWHSNLSDRQQPSFLVQ